MKMRMRSIMLVMVLFGAAGACQHMKGQRDTWEPPTVVRIQATEEMMSLFPSWGAWFSAAEDEQSQALLLRDGDYFVGESEQMVRYAAGDGQALEVSFTNWSARMGATIVSLSLGEEAGRIWMGAAADRQLADLRMVSIPAEIDATTLAALKRIAAVNPHVDLYFHSDAAFSQTLSLFQPRAVFLDEGASATSLQALAHQPELETLMIPAAGAGSFDVLPTLPKLRRLMIGKWDVALAGPLPPGLQALKSLIVFDSRDEMKDLSALRNVSAGLDELSLPGLTHLTDIAEISHMTGLRTLILFGDEGIGDLSSLASHTRLRWFGLPPKTGQEQFAAFVGAHPDLRVLDLMGNNAVTNLAPLGSLKSLQAVVLDGPYENLDVVQGLTSLRFVGISKVAMEAAPGQVAAIRKSLPDAVVVCVAPLCLGSGWILLLASFVTLTWAFRRSRRRARFST